MAQIRTNAYTTLARLKSLLSLNGDKLDTAITIYINMACGAIDSYLGFGLARQTYTQEQQDATDDNMILLNVFPVASVATLQYNQSLDNSADWVTFAAADYFWYEDGRIKLVGKNIIDRPQRYRATYDAGYLIDFANETDPTKHTLPGDIEYAVSVLVGGMLNKRRAGGLTMERVGDTINQFAPLIAGDPEVCGILDGYRQPAL